DGGAHRPSRARYRGHALASDVARPRARSLGTGLGREAVAHVQAGSRLRRALRVGEQQEGRGRPRLHTPGAPSNARARDSLLRRTRVRFTIPCGGHPIRFTLRRVMKPFTIRPAREADLDRLIEIHRCSYPDDRNYVERERNFTRNALGTLSDLRVVEHDGRVVAHGFLFSGAIGIYGGMLTMGAIASLGVAPEARRR